MRVCHVITRLIVGGAQECALQVCAHVDQSAFPSRLVTGPQTGPEGSLHGEAEMLGIGVTVVPDLVREINPWRDRRALGQLRRAIREAKPHIVHTHSSKAGILGRLAARLERVPAVVHTVHGWSYHEHQPLPVRAAYVVAERIAARGTGALVVVCAADERKGLRGGVGKPAQYRYIPCGIDLERFRDARRAPAADLALAPPVVGWIGRLSPQKDPLAFVRVAAELRARGCGARFVVVGDGPLRGETEQLAARAGLGPERLVLTGLRRDVPALLGRLQVLVVTSRWEGMPRLLPEAMAAGVPVVATRADGIVDVVRDGDNGLLADVGDTGAIANLVQQLLDDPALARRLASRGRETAEQFGLAAMVRSYEALYRELTSHAG